jgi:hypothetical protein
VAPGPQADSMSTWWCEQMCWAFQKTSCGRLKINIIPKFVSVKFFSDSLMWSSLATTVSHSFENGYQGNAALQSPDSEHVAELCAKWLLFRDKIFVH